MSLDRDNFALLIHKALENIRQHRPFSKNVMRIFKPKESNYCVKENYFEYLESSFIHSLYPKVINSLEFTENNRSKTTEDLYKEFIEPIKQFQNHLEALVADEKVLERTIFINPLEVELILSAVEHSQKKEELYKEFIKNPDQVMLGALNSLRKPGVTLSHFEKMDMRRDQQKRYKPSHVL